MSYAIPVAKTLKMTLDAQKWQRIKPLFRIHEKAEQLEKEFKTEAQRKGSTTDLKDKYITELRKYVGDPEDYDKEERLKMFQIERKLDDQITKFKID